ncbi:hypothetical protein ACO0LO_27020 [Undibacterium sp. TJN25]|uniref:hypothetical protein n=1 Tax=Undibacterium sp. TJN25 TaxID=3413056 RepID=UPI003BEF8BE5
MLAITLQVESGSDDPTRANHYDVLAKTLCAEIKGSDERAGLASFDIAQSDDLDCAVHALVVAVKDYAAGRQAAAVSIRIYMRASCSSQHRRL